MHVRRRCLAWIDERVDAVNDQLRASEPQHGESIVSTKLRSCLGERRKGKKAGETHRELKGSQLALGLEQDREERDHGDPIL